MKKKSKKISKKLWKKKLWNLPPCDKKIISSLYDTPSGLSANTLKKLTNFKTSHLYKRMKILKDDEILENIDKVWKISNGQYEKCRMLLKNNNIFELHNMSYVIKLMRVPDWWNKRKNYLIRLKEWQFKNISWGKGNTNPYQQLMNENFVIQCYPESLIIIARKRYYSNNPYETIKEAMNDLLDLLDWFNERFKFNFFLDGIPHIQIRNNDFNRINDAIAKHVKKENGSFLVEIDQRRKVWIDRSEPFGKEANYPEGQEILEKHTKDILLNKPLTLSEIQGVQQKNTQQLGQLITQISQYGEHISSHTKSIQTLSKAMPELIKILDELKKENKKLKQRKLSEFE